MDHYPHNDCKAVPDGFGYTFKVTHAAFTVNPGGITATGDSNAVPTIVFANDYRQQISDLINSVALEEAALAAIANAEDRKIQKTVAIPNIPRHR